MAEMEQLSPPAISGFSVNGGQIDLRFRRPRGMWGRIPLSLIFVVLFWVILMTHGNRHPLTEPFFVFAAGLALLYGVATAYLVARAPQELVVEGLTLVGRFRSRVREMKLSEIAIKHVPELLYKGVVILDGGGERFVIFSNMKGFDALMEAIRERSVAPDSPMCQMG